MYTDPEELGPTDGKTRGMPYLALSEDQIDQLIAYLLWSASDSESTRTVLLGPLDRTVAATAHGHHRTSDPGPTPAPGVALSSRRRRRYGVVPPARCPPPAGGRGCSRSTTRSSASCTASAPWSFFLVGGIEALLIRAQLAGPDGKVLSADLYNQMFTMHATSMVFLFAMPMAAAFGNYFLPLQVGARDVAFPRINAFGFWCFLFGALFINTSWILGGAADGGWFMYAPNSSVAVLADPRHRHLGPRPA